MYIYETYIPYGFKKKKKNLYTYNKFVLLSDLTIMVKIMVMWKLIELTLYMLK